MNPGDLLFFTRKEVTYFIFYDQKIKWHARPLKYGSILFFVKDCHAYPGQEGIWGDFKCFLRANEMVLMREVDIPALLSYSEIFVGTR